MKKHSKLPIVILAVAVAVIGFLAVFFLVKAMQLGKNRPAESSAAESSADAGSDAQSSGSDRPAESRPSDPGTSSGAESAPGQSGGTDADPASSDDRSGGSSAESGDPASAPAPTDPPVPTVVPSAVATLVTTGPPEALFALTPEKVKSASASSSYEADSSGGSEFGPEKAGDRDVTTAWMEGSGKGGSGEYVKLVFEKPVEVRYIALYLGNWKSYEDFDRYGRPEVLTLYLGGQSFQLSFGDFPTGQYIVFDLPVRTEDLTISIDKAFPGSSGGCCISEVEVYADPTRQ